MKRMEIGRQTAFWLVGFIIGILFAYLSNGEVEQMKQYMGMQSLVNIVYYQIDYNNYLKYLIRKRGLLLAILLFGAMTVVGKYVLSAFIMFLGISMGATVTFLIYQYQVKGLLLFLAMLFPQILCYAPALFDYINMLSGLNEKVFGDKNMLQIQRKSVFESRRIVRMIGVTIIGIIIECYVNPSFVKLIIKNM